MTGEEPKTWEELQKIWEDYHKELKGKYSQKRIDLIYQLGCLLWLKKHDPLMFEAILNADSDVERRINTRHFIEYLVGERKTWK